MKASKNPPARKRALLVSSLAAKLLGHTRVAGIAISAQRLSAAFPAFNADELASAVEELIEKELLIQKGLDGRASYSLTEYGRDGRVGIA